MLYGKSFHENEYGLIRKNCFWKEVTKNTYKLVLLSPSVSTARAAEQGARRQCRETEWAEKKKNHFIADRPSASAHSETVRAS